MEDLDECMEQQKSFAEYAGVLSQAASMLRAKENNGGSPGFVQVD